ncbi:MAG: hypothetical protein ACO3PI_10000 [Burkholderiaceae bacterium]
MLNLVPEHRLNFRVVIVDGPDALSFLQAQLCNDVNGLAQPSSGAPPVAAVQAQLSGYCNAKGRLYASFWIWRDSAEQFRLLLPASLATSVVKRLSMFILRAKVKVREADSVIYGGSLTQPIDFAAFAAQGLTLLPAERPHQTRSNNDRALLAYWPAIARRAFSAKLSPGPPGQRPSDPLARGLG